MKTKYSFKGGQRGKFYRASVIVELPVYLDQEVCPFFQNERLERRCRWTMS